MVFLKQKYSRGELAAGGIGQEISRRGMPRLYVENISAENMPASPA